MQLLERDPLLVAQDVLTQAYSARLVELDHVAQVCEDRAHLQGAPEYLRDGVPPRLHAADQDLGVQLRVSRERRQLSADGRAVPDLPRELQDLQKVIASANQIPAHGARQYLRKRPRSKADVIRSDVDAELLIVKAVEDGLVGRLSAFVSLLRGFGVLVIDVIIAALDEMLAPELRQNTLHNVLV